MAGERTIGGRYSVGRKIAEGGMGAVYEGTHLLSKKTVALKLLAPNVGRDETTRSRFLREVAAPAQIGHDGIVEIYDAGFDPIEGILFVAMELLSGQTLRDRLIAGPMPHAQVLELFDQMLQPLAAAHRAGIVHRDLKPENIFLAKKRDGTDVVKVLDFGIARDLAGSDTVTQAGTAMGTPHYMSPEQAMSARDVTFSTDVWALGVMLYETLSGAPPFSGETIATIVVEICTKPHMPLQQAAPTVAPAVASLVDRCLDKDATKRPANAGELLTALRQARGSSVSVPPTVRRELAPTMAQSAVTLEQVQANATGAVTADLRPSAQTPPTVGQYASPMQNVATPSAPLIPTTALGPRPPMPSYTPAPSAPPSSVPSYPGYSPPAPSGRPRWLVPAAIVGAFGCLGIGGLVVLVFGLAVLGAVVGGDAEVDGDLAYGDAQSGRGAFSDVYEYTWSAGDRVAITLTSPDFDTYLVVRTPSGREVVDDDGGGGLNSRLDMTLDESGSYQVTATSYSSGSTGRYHLSVQRP